jgi:hypothetical protein
MTPRRLPTPDELDDAPQLAIVAALDQILDLTLRTLVSLHPQLGDAECPHWVRDVSPASEAADRILAAARPLADALEAYRGVVAARRGDPIETDPAF